MDPQEKARELLAKERQHNHETHQKMVNRAHKAQESYEEKLEEKARDLLTEERKERQHVKDNMLSRSSEEISAGE